MGNGSAAGMWMNGSIFQSEWPASRTRTLVPESAESRFASAQPAEPPPTMTTSYRSLAIARPPAYPSNQRCSAGRTLCQTCLVSRYSSRPASPSSRPMPDCL